MTGADIEAALQAVGDLLAETGPPIRLVVVGGASLSVGGWVARATTDVDVLARATAAGLVHPDPLPDALVRAAATVARDFRLAPDWLNTHVALQRSQGMPPGLARDLDWRTYGPLSVGFAGRRTLIALKLFAAADRGPRNVRVQDLLALRPTDDELRTAATWVQTQDASPVFADLLDDVIRHAQRQRTHP